MVIIVGVVAMGVSSYLEIEFDSAVVVDNSFRKGSFGLAHEEHRQSLVNDIARRHVMFP